MIRFSSFLFSLVFLLMRNRNVSTNENQTAFPIIGIVSQEMTTQFKELFPIYSSLIVASYVKAVESSGARVIPILISRNESYYRFRVPRELLNSVNGIVLPGGRSEHGPGNPYYDTVTTIHKIAKEINDQNPGIKFPILGVCLGYEFLITIANNDKSILKNCNINYENLPLDFNADYKEGNLFSGLSNKQCELLKTTNVTVNHHKWCAYEEDFLQSSLKNNWIITSTSTSYEGIKFIATIEHKKYPFYGLQFHPEKIAFEWNKKFNFPHSEDALHANRYFYDFLVKISKMNDNMFKDPDVEYNQLIYNYNPIHSRHIQSYEQIYMFE